MRCYRRLLNTMHKDHVTNEEVRDKIKAAIDKRLSMTISPFHCEKMVWSYLKSLWHGQDNFVRGLKRNKKGRKTTSRTAQDWGLSNMLRAVENEPRHEKTGLLHMRKQRRRSASR